MARGWVAVAACLLAWGPGAAWAHAFLSASTPGVGSTVRGAPAEVAITFTEAVEPRFSTITVMDGGGQRVDKGDLHAGADGRELAVSLGALPPGVYHVSWHALSSDTHRTEGTFTFTVAP